MTNKHIKAINLLRVELENRNIKEMHIEGGYWVDACECLNELTIEQLSELLDNN